MIAACDALPTCPFGSSTAVASTTRLAAIWLHLEAAGTCSIGTPYNSKISRTWLTIYFQWVVFLPPSRRPLLPPSSVSSSSSRTRYVAHILEVPTLAPAFLMRSWPPSRQPSAARQFGALSAIRLCSCTGLQSPNKIHILHAVSVADFIFHLTG